MNRSDYRLKVIVASILLGSAFLAGVAPSAASQLVATVEGAGGSVPMGITADVSAVPDLPSISVAPPYQLTWQKRLLAFQMKFENELSPSEANIDPIETGSISESR